MRAAILLPALLLLLLAGCGQDTPRSKVRRSAPPETVGGGPPTGLAPKGEPQRVTVDHILVAVPNDRMPNTRHSSAAAAKATVDRILQQLEDGADWAELKRQHSEDPPPGGPYTMANVGVRPERGEFPRQGMAKAFGDVGFSLAVGEIAVAEHDPRTSPFGFHIIKRVK